MTDYKTRKIRLIGQAQKDLAKAAIDNAPIDRDLEVSIKQYRPERSMSQQSLMWVGPLADISEQAWFKGAQYSTQVWHDTYKRLHLPEDDDPDLERLVKDPDTWHKWADSPNDGKLLIGSTKLLTRYGFSQYLEQVMADGASMGVLFRARPSDRGGSGNG
jgi:hypothetical protein